LDAAAVDGLRGQPPEVHCLLAWTNFFLYCLESLDIGLVLILNIADIESNAW
jgi:hypothetical protein